MKQNIGFLIFTLVISFASMKSSSASSSSSNTRQDRSKSPSGGEDSGGGIKRKKSNKQTSNSNKWQSSSIVQNTFVDLFIDDEIISIDTKSLCTLNNTKDSSTGIELELKDSRQLNHHLEFNFMVDKDKSFEACSEIYLVNNLCQLINEKVNFMTSQKGSVYIKTKRSIEKIELCNSNKQEI
jgi:hypothetical protein